MTPEEEYDYQEALRRIKEAEENKSPELDLGGLEHLTCFPPELARLASLQPPSRRGESVAGAGANPTVGAGAIQSAARSACDKALPATPWPLVAQDSEKLCVWCRFQLIRRLTIG